MLKFLTFHEWCVYKVYKGNALQEDIFSGYYDYAYPFVRTVVDNFNAKYFCRQISKLEYCGLAAPEQELLVRLSVWVEDNYENTIKFFEHGNDWYYVQTESTYLKKWCIFKPQHLEWLVRFCEHLRITTTSESNSLFDIQLISSHTESLSQSMLDSYKLSVERYGI